MAIGIYISIITLNISLHSLWPAEFLLKDQLLNIWGFPCMLFIAFPLLLLRFFVFNLCQFYQNVSWHVSLWVYPVWESLPLLDLIDYFLFHVGKIFNYNFFKNFLISFLFLFFWDPYNLNIVTFNIVPDVSETILSSFLSFYFILFFSSYQHHFIFQLTDPFCFRYSTIDSFQSIFNFSSCLVCLCVFIL